MFFFVLKRLIWLLHCLADGPEQDVALVGLESSKICIDDQDKKILLIGFCFASTAVVSMVLVVYLRYYCHKGRSFLKCK